MRRRLLGQRVDGYYNEIPHYRRLPHPSASDARTSPTPVVKLAGLLVGFVSLILALHEAVYFIALRQIAIPVNSLHSTASLNSATAAVVSLHRGSKYYGSLGTWLSQTKQAYASQHGYAYVDKLPANESLLQPLNAWQSLRRRKVMYDKTRFILYLLETYPNLRHLLWIDGDAVFANPSVTIEDRVKLFQTLQTSHARTNELCLVWAADGNGPNAGVLLLLNSPLARALLKQTLATYNETDPVFDRFTDQASLTAAVTSDFQNCTLLLNGIAAAAPPRTTHAATLLQSRVRGSKRGLYTPGDWILHLPNHNRFELLQSLTTWLVLP